MLILMPLGSAPRFPGFLEELSGRFLAPRKGGRPRKAATQGKARKPG